MLAVVGDNHHQILATHARYFSWQTRRVRNPFDLGRINQEAWRCKPSEVTYLKEGDVSFDVERRKATSSNLKQGVESLSIIFSSTGNGHF